MEQWGKAPRALLSDPKIAPGPKALYVTIWALQSERPDQERLAACLGVTTRTVRSWTRALERAHWLTVDGEPGEAKRYRLRVAVR